MGLPAAIFPSSGGAVWVGFVQLDAAVFAVIRADKTFYECDHAALNKYQPKGERLFNQACKSNGSTKRCKSFRKQHPGFKSAADYKVAFIYLNQICRIKESGWIYQSSACQAGMAHGKGRAINNEKQLSFAGHFVKGHQSKR